VELGGDIRQGSIGPDRQGDGAGRADGVDRDREAGRVLDEDGSRIAVRQAAAAESAAAGADGPGDPRPRGPRARHGVDERGLIACLASEFQDAFGNRAVRDTRAQGYLVRLDARPRADATFHQNLPDLTAATGGSWRGAGTRPASAAGLLVPTPPWEPAGGGVYDPPPPCDSDSRTLCGRDRLAHEATCVREVKPSLARMFAT